MGYQWWAFTSQKVCFISPNYFFSVLVGLPPGYRQTPFEELVYTWYLKSFAVYNRLLSFLSIAYLSRAPNHLLGRGWW